MIQKDMIMTNMKRKMEPAISQKVMAVFTNISESPIKFISK